MNTTKSLPLKQKRSKITLMKTFGVATKAVIFNTEMQKYLVLMKSEIEDINPNTFDIPGGRVSFGEQLEDAIIREVKEESGLDIKPLSVFNAWTFVKDGNFQLTGIDFLCETNQSKVVLSHEHSDFEWSTGKEIIKDKKYPKWLRKTIQKVERIRK